VIPKILPVGQQFLVSLQLSIILSHGFGDPPPCGVQVVEGSHDQLNFGEVAPGRWHWPHILPRELDLARLIKSYASQDKCDSLEADVLRGVHVDQIYNFQGSDPKPHHATRH
jgi:hypothetical protein